MNHKLNDELRKLVAGWIVLLSHKQLARLEPMLAMLVNKNQEQKRSEKKW